MKTSLHDLRPENGRVFPNRQDLKNWRLYVGVAGLLAGGCLLAAGLAALTQHSAWFWLQALLGNGVR